MCIIPSNFLPWSHICSSYRIPLGEFRLGVLKAEQPWSSRDPTWSCSAGEARYQVARRSSGSSLGWLLSHNVLGITGGGTGEILLIVFVLGLFCGRHRLQCRRACNYGVLSSTTNKNLGTEFFKFACEYAKMPPKEAKPKKKWWFW